MKKITKEAKKKAAEVIEKNVEKTEEEIAAIIEENAEKTEEEVAAVIEEGVEKTEKEIDSIIKKDTEKLGIMKRYRDLYLSKITQRKNLRRDIGVIFFLAVFLGVILSTNVISYPSLIKDGREFLANLKERENRIPEEQIYEEVKAVQETVDSSNWKMYQSRWYGFEVKYPEDWIKPVVKNGTNQTGWEYKYQFRKNVQEDDVYVGFDVIVYGLAKTGDLLKTEEFSLVSNDDAEAIEKCQNLEGHLIETGDYPAEEVYIQPGDTCYESLLFFSFTKGEYIYSIIPVRKDEGSEDFDPRVEIMDNFPEFFVVASTLNPIDIVRPKIIARPAIRAPKPAWSKKDSLGRAVCAKKNDDPGKSKQNKKKHLDMECCLDPDEYPNPHCYYDPKKYGKYL